MSGHTTVPLRGQKGEMYEGGYPSPHVCDVARIHSRRNTSRSRLRYLWTSFRQYARQLAHQSHKASKDVQSGRHSKANNRTSRSAYFTGYEEKEDNSFSDSANMPSGVATSNCCTTARLNRWSFTTYQTTHWKRPTTRRSETALFREMSQLFQSETQKAGSVPWQQ